MKIASTILLALAGAAALAAIWTPWWWQFLATALVLSLAGAALGGAAGMRGPAPHPADGSDLEQHFREKFEHEQRHTRPTYGKPSKENDQ